MNTQEQVRQLYDEFGQRKKMGMSAPDTIMPHYFLHRTFMGENDLLIIFNTKRCAYQCYFCQLPAKSTSNWVLADDIIAQFMYVVEEMKHSLSVFDRLTFSNEGSILDANTFPTEALLGISKCVHELRRVHTLVIETRLEYLDGVIIKQIRQLAPRVRINILTGFETCTPEIRDKVLFKRESLTKFEEGLNKVADYQLDLTAYVLFKPSQIMTDEEAYIEASKTIDYLNERCIERNISFSIRLNPMYAAKGSRWAKIAQQNPNYRPPRLTDVMRLAESKRYGGIRIYIGLSTEGLDNGSSYETREDYSSALIKQVKLFNDEKITRFDWGD
jgi:radical SAM enzyme (TIGR01210 family)